MALAGVVDVAVHFVQFRNIDLFHQGYAPPIAPAPLP